MTRAKTVHPQIFFRIPILSTMFRFTSCSYHEIGESEEHRKYYAFLDWKSECSRRKFQPLQPDNKLIVEWAEVRAIFGGMEWEAKISGIVAETAKTDPE